ncbi:hypothetical protein HDU87_008512 [Geranomyces variabilis]|uniref:Myb-like domain-containing protein n=1 Tax=Geranomyces variabilis TaxID=109894 RepID=A0AAD5TQW7_9FUNG|nr:hypothetical protein HDU87_008512 [Geranomyces variabilis]
MSAARLVTLLPLIPLRPRLRLPFTCNFQHTCQRPPPVRAHNSRSQIQSQIPTTTPANSAEPYDPIAFSKLAKELGLKMRLLPRYRPEPSAWNWTHADDIKLCQLVFRGQSFYEIAAQMGRPSKSVMYRYSRLCRTAQETADYAAATTTTTTTTTNTDGPASSSSEGPKIVLPGTDIPMVMTRQRGKKKSKASVPTASSRWTEEEDAILKKMYAAGRSPREIVARLPSRNEKGIAARCYRLKLSRRIEPRTSKPRSKSRSD